MEGEVGRADRKEGNAEGATGTAQHLEPSI